MTSLPHPQLLAPVVFLLDDDPNDVLIIRRVCESVGLAIRDYQSPQEFFEALRPLDHGCVVADLLMPEMTGLQVHNELKRRNCDLPIIVVTGHADAKTCRQALREGVFDFVEKSFNPHDLLVVIRAAIDQHARQLKESRVRKRYLQQLEMLSRREGEVMHLLADGRSLKEIAGEFGISVQTASKHRGSLFEKLGVSNEVELLKLLIRIDPSHALPDPTAAA
jgi:FixJ family two-component response regulator